MQTLWGAVSDDGGRRPVNEDAVLARPPVFIVADGMGGHHYGALASHSVVRAFAEFADRIDPAVPVQPAHVLEAIEHAKHLIRAGVRAARSATESQEDPVAGSTVAGAVLTSQHGSPCWLLFNIGDSRIYRHGEGGLNQISVDHSMVQELLDAGAITAAQAQHHPQRNVITRAVGSTRDAEVDFWMLPAHPSQRLLLCSDGLTSEVTTAEVARALSSPAAADEVCTDLVRRATLDGARDNVSVVVVDLLTEGFADQPPTSTMAGAGAAAGLLDDLEDTVPRPGTGAFR